MSLLDFMVRFCSLLADAMADKGSSVNYRATYRHFVTLSFMALADLWASFAAAASDILKARMNCCSLVLQRIDPQVQATLLH